MSDNLAVSPAEIFGCLQFLRTHLYAAQAQAVPGDDTIIMRHVYDAYKRVSDVCKEVELHGIAHPAAPAPHPMRIGPSSGFHNISTLTACPWAAPAPDATADLPAHWITWAQVAGEADLDQIKEYAEEYARAAVEQIVRERDYYRETCSYWAGDAALKEGK